MGVLACNRKHCNSIMCDTYIQKIGYICYDCQSEFKKYLEKNNLNPKSEGQITLELEKFMATSKDYYQEGSEMSVDTFFKEHTK